MSLRLVPSHCSFCLCVLSVDYLRAELDFKYLYALVFVILVRCE